MSNDLPRLGLLRRYMVAAGWIKQQLSVAGLAIFSLKDLPEIEIVLPDDPTVQDTDRRINEAIRTISSVEEVPINEVRQNIVALGYDLLEGVIPDEKVFKNSIKLRVAEGFLRSTRNLMFQAASSFFESLGDFTSSAASEFADECNFGHTFPGSFGFRVLSPVGPNTNNFVDDSLFPLERTIMMRLQHGLSAVERSYREDDISILHKDSLIGLNANGYEAVARLLERSEADSVSFRFRFSPEWQVERPSLQANMFSIKAAAIPNLRSAAKDMRKVEFDLPEAEVRGRVVKLASKYVPTDLFHPGGREISILWESRDFGDVSVRARLSAEQYLAALYAHEQGLDVSVFGLLEPYGSGLRFLGIHDFHIVGSSDAGESSS